MKSQDRRSQIGSPAQHTPSAVPAIIKKGNNMTNYLQVIDNNIQISPEWLEKYRAFKATQLKMDLAEKEFKEQLKEAMEKTGKTSVIVDGFSAVVKKPATRTSLDSKRLKAELPDIFEQYSKTSEVKSSITITVE